MTKTNTQMLADLNALRVAKGLKPLKAWKESTVKLAECLAKMGGKIEAPAPKYSAIDGIRDVLKGADPVKTADRVITANSKIEAEPAGDTVVKKPAGHVVRQIASRKANAAAKAAGEPKPVKAAPASNNRKGIRTLGEGEVHLTTIANSLKLAPKAARAIARTNKSAIAKLQVPGKKYVFTKANVAAVRAILEAPAKGK